MAITKSEVQIRRLRTTESPLKCFLSHVLTFRLFRKMAQITSETGKQAIAINILHCISKL